MRNNSNSKAILAKGYSLSLLVASSVLAVLLVRWQVAGTVGRVGLGLGERGRCQAQGPGQGQGRTERDKTGSHARMMPVYRKDSTKHSI